MSGGAWEAVIGLEVHLQLATRSKLFCGCATRFGDRPNANVCPVCLGLPGALPVPNEAAVALAVRAALALECTVHPRSRFARKHYFYPDLPKGYQISQYGAPLATGGVYEADGLDDRAVRVRVQRLHIEEDAGKSRHDLLPGATAVDLNRCGVPLIEIVTAPDLRSPADARRFLRALHRLVVFLEVSEGRMEEGNLRVDANLSVRRAGESALGPKTEIKNLNSFASVERALEAERRRQVARRASGRAVARETLLFDAASGALRPVRAKEESPDYRYVADPDLPPLVVTEGLIAAQADQLPELPRARRDRFVAQFGLPARDADVLTATRALADYFEATVAAGLEPRVAANWITVDVLADARRHGGRLRVEPRTLAELEGLVARQALSRLAARRVLREVAERGGEPRQVAQRQGLLQVANRDVLSEWVEAVLAAHPEVVRRYRGGDAKLLGFLIGEVMRRSGGRADPRAVGAVLRDRLS